MDWLDWVKLVNIPALVGLGVWLLRMQLAFANYKTKVAEEYVTIAYLQDVERRIEKHLDRIEGKIDGFVKSEHGR
ncbi:MAG: hypothetical protein MI806_07370 [Minwuiales bacterium]|nr:hypothetical protein [Minwuiales bacterium]